jgi:hypothetical protein
MLGKTLAIVLVLAACGTNPLPAGAVCKQSNDCEAGLSCLELAQFTGPTCTVVGETCTVTCQHDTDCATLGTNFKCFATCGSDMTCAEIVSP